MTSSNPSSLSFCDSVPSVSPRHSIYAPVLISPAPEVPKLLSPLTEILQTTPSSVRMGTWRTCCTPATIGCRGGGGGAGRRIDLNLHERAHWFMRQTWAGSINPPGRGWSAQDFRAGRVEGTPGPVKQARRCLWVRGANRLHPVYSRSASAASL